MPRAREKRIRTRVGTQLTEMTSRVGGNRKKRKKKPVRAVDRLEATLTQMRGRKAARHRAGRFS
jgi:hypothetical protein